MSPSTTWPPLPIDEALPALRRALAGRSSAVLQAPPGAGKTTRVPLALLDEPWTGGARILMLEPRRVAARAAARQMARLLGEEVGGTVGYRMRLDTRVGPRTRIEVVTEGVLARMLQHDPALEGVAALLFDEFHERSLHADLGLALALQSRELLRPDLRLVVMSATLDAAPVAALLGGAEIITSEGRAWPVAVRWLGPPVRGAVEAAVASAVRRALDAEPGDVLAFLPGRAEIERTRSLLAESLPPSTDLLPLHGELPSEAQDAAIRPAPPGRRKVVLATTIAETSLTIDGVRVVVDAGLARVPRFSARTGMGRLETVRVSRDSADQRAGRAGRLAPGVCYRLWSEGEHAALLPRSRPEILEADLAPLALELAAAGVRDPADLRWLDPPPDAALAQARALLTELGALEPGGQITPHGRALAEMPLHPRLAHLVRRGDALGQGVTAVRIAALLDERDIYGRGDAPPEADLRQRVEIVAERGMPQPAHGAPIRRDALHRVRDSAARWQRRLIRSTGDDPGATGALLALAFPDRAAQRRPGPAGRYLLRNGRGVTLDPSDPLAREPWLVVASVGDTGADGRIYLAARIDEAELRAALAHAIEREEEIVWDADAAAVRGRVRERIGALVLHEAVLRDADPAQVADVLARAVERSGLELLPWAGSAHRLRERVAFLRVLDPARWPDLSLDALRATLDDWLVPHLAGLSSAADLARLDLTTLLLGRLGWADRAALEELAPTHYVAPTGSRLPIDYTDPHAPAVAVRLQELFGTPETPRIAGGRVPLTLRLLSPAQRPVQVTRDLGGFWAGSYAAVRKDLRGRYPKHEWPEDPLAAAPTRRAKPRPR